jgi:hypothetical protein
VKDLPLDLKLGTVDTENVLAGRRLNALVFALPKTLIRDIVVVEECHDVVKN